MYRDVENRDTTGAQAPPRRIIRRPRILARRVVQRKSPNTPISIESATSDPKPCSTEKEGSGNDKMDEASRAEAIFGCAALGELLRKNQPLPVTEHVPVFDDSQLCMRFGDEEDVSDRVRMIGVALAEHALKALRTVSENEPRFQVPIGVQARSYPACYRIAIWTDIAVINQFTFPKEAAKVNLNSADDPASVSQILSGSHPVEQDNPSTSSSRSPIILRITRTKSGGQKASMLDHTAHQPIKRKGYRKDQEKVDVVTRKRKAETYDSPSTSLGYGSSIKQREDDADEVEHLTPEERGLIDQVLMLCRQFIRSIDYTDAKWYSKLKKAIYLRLKQLTENRKNIMSRRRELRERNEELRRLHQNLIERNRISEPQYAYEEILPSPNAEYRDPSTDYGDPQQSGWF